MLAACRGLHEVTGTKLDFDGLAVFFPTNGQRAFEHEEGIVAAQLEYGLFQVLSGISIKMPAGDVSALEGYEAGEWWVQDVAAALPVHLLGAHPGETVLDLCAAPGGKTMQLAATGAQVTALDRSAARLERVEENLARTKLDATVEIVTAKLEDWTPPALADRVLLDAPCSALGTLRRHPEGAWIKSSDDIARFPEVQARLIRAAAGMLTPGGTLVYCVCTPLSREGRDVVKVAATAEIELEVLQAPQRVSSRE